MMARPFAWFVVAMAVAAWLDPAVGADVNRRQPSPALGPLRVHPTNPRYFTDGTTKRDGSLRTVYLTGSHTWGNLCDYRTNWPAFDYAGYLDFLGRYHHNFIRFIRQCEAAKPRQHPVGMTAVFNILNGSWATDNRVLFDSPADWISPGLDPYKDSPPAADGKKVIIADVDHIWPTPPHRGWIWECFLRGIQPILMDTYCYGKPEWTSVEEQEALRKQMGYALDLARKVNLATMTPRPELASTTYCLANPGNEYLVYQPKRSAAFSVELKAGTYRYEWFDPGKGGAADSGSTESSGQTREFKAPFEGDAVLYLSAQ